MTLASAAEQGPVSPSECDRDESDTIHFVGPFGIPGIMAGPAKLSREEWQACYASCKAENGERPWAFTLDAIEPDSGMMKNGFPYILAKFGEPLHVEQSIRNGFWDIDIYMVPRTLTYPGFRAVTHDYIDDSSSTITDDSEVEESGAIYELIVDGDNIKFQFGLAIGSTRAEVEKAIGLPCMNLANNGLKRVRLSSQYGYAAEDPEGNQNFDFTVYFDDVGNLNKVHWTLRPWH